MIPDLQIGNVKPHRDLRVLILTESGVRCRYWEGAVLLLQASGTEVVLATVRERGPLHAHLESLGCPTLALGCRTSRDYPCAAVRLARFIRKHDIQIIHANESIPAVIGGIAGVLARRGIRIFHRQHCSLDGITRGFSRLGSQLADMVMAVSHAAARDAQRLDGVPPARVRVAYSGVAIPPPVTADEVAALRRELGIPASAAVVSIVARLAPEKGHRTLLDAVLRVTNALAQPLHLVIVGSGPEDAMLRQRAQSLRPGTVHFVGYQQHVAPWYAMADVVAMPSYREAFGLSAAEAMACRRPLVASRVGGLPEVIEDGTTGLLVKPRDPDGLANAFLRLLASPSLRIRMGGLSYRRFQSKFTLDSMVSAWRSCYEEALAARRAQQRSG